MAKDWFYLLIPKSEFPGLELRLKSEIKMT